MDKNISHFQSMLDQNSDLLPMLFISTQTNPSNLTEIEFNNYQLKPSFGHNDYDQFFISSPIPFRNESHSSEKSYSELEANNDWENGFQSFKIQHFQDQISSDDFSHSPNLSHHFYEESSTESKDKESHQQLYQRRKVSRKLKKQSLKQKLSNQVKLQSQEPDDFYLNDFKRHGTLKSVSSAILSILLKSGETTFPEVSQKLIQFFQKEEEKKGSNLQEAHKKNLKRRVYDGLNVFVATGLANKFGKSLRLKPKFKDQCIAKSLRKMKSKSENNKNVEEIKEQINQSLKRLEAKKNLLKELTAKKQNLKSFFELRSQQNSLKKNTVKIPFPFVCVGVNPKNACEIYQCQSFKNQHNQQKESQATCDTNLEEDVVTIRLPQLKTFETVKLQGDIDFIEQLGQLLKSQKK